MMAPVNTSPEAAHPSAIARRMTLAELPPGARARVCGIEGAEEIGSRLRELGFCESAIIERLSGPGTLVCELCGSRIALNRQVGRHILVELVGAAA
jgi:ferrous iron transport protein A